MRISWRDILKSGCIIPTPQNSCLGCLRWGLDRAMLQMLPGIERCSVLTAFVISLTSPPGSLHASLSFLIEFDGFLDTRLERTLRENPIPHLGIHTPLFLPLLNSVDTVSHSHDTYHHVLYWSYLWTRLNSSHTSPKKAETVIPKGHPLALGSHPSVSVFFLALRVFSTFLIYLPAFKIQEVFLPLPTLLLNIMALCNAFSVGISDVLLTQAPRSCRAVIGWSWVARSPFKWGLCSPIHPSPHHSLFSLTGPLLSLIFLSWHPWGTWMCHPFDFYTVSDFS